MLALHHRAGIEYHVSTLHKLKLLSRRVGLDVGRFPQDAAGYGLYRSLTASHPKTILDVGANDGGFARLIRAFGCTATIVSFEPLQEVADQLRANASHDPDWNVLQLALGARNEERQINVAANSGASSSLLAMAQRHRDASPAAVYVGKERVSVRRLEDVAAEHGKSWGSVALKVDTQGFERAVLEGAGTFLNDVVAVQLELSIAELYEGAWQWQEAVNWLRGRGFELSAVDPGFCDVNTGEMLQFDGVFARIPGSERR